MTAATLETDRRIHELHEHLASVRRLRDRVRGPIRRHFAQRARHLEMEIAKLDRSTFALVDTSPAVR